MTRSYRKKRGRNGAASALPTALRVLTVRPRPGDRSKGLLQAGPLIFPCALGGRDAADLGWCEVPDDRNYNRPVRLPYPVSHEYMQRPDRLYDACLVLDWNIRPRRRGRGSAIFFHLARPDFTPTQGCVAVSARTMARLLPLLSDRTVVRVVR